MNENIRQRLLNLLPSIYRIRDEEAKSNGSLQAILQVIEGQLQAVEKDIDGLYDDWFIETCSEWVIPYIGDLVGNKPIYDINQTRRVDVTRTIGYRRRKGTTAMLEQMAQDVTGWGAHVVEFYKLLGWTQNLNHFRFQPAVNPDLKSPSAVDCVGTINLRSSDVVDRTNSPFDIVSHTVDIRPINDINGWYNIRNLGFFLWRLQPYTLSGIIPRRVPNHPHFYTFSRLGNKTHLFNKPQRPVEESSLTTEVDVPGLIRGLVFRLDLEDFAAGTSTNPANSQYYGPDRGLNIVRNGFPVKPQDVVSLDLGSFASPPEGKVAIDVEHGLLAIGAASGAGGTKLAEEEVRVTYTYGFSADVGGGPYERRPDMADPGPVASERDEITEIVEVAKDPAVVNRHPAAVNTLQKALSKVRLTWNSHPRRPCVIRILDNEMYGGNVDIDLPDQGWLVLQADNGVWPDVRLVGRSSNITSGGTATLIIDGLLIEGALELNGSLNLTLQHCTLVPGRLLDLNGEATNPDRDSLVFKAASADMQVTVKSSIIGPIRLPASIKSLLIEDSIVQAPLVKGHIRPAIAEDDKAEKPGPALTLKRTTVFGPVHVKELDLVCESILTSEVRTQRQQIGCVRFSYVTLESIVPRRYHCQPDMAVRQEAKYLGRDLTPKEIELICARLQPRFTSVNYGEPGYAQLLRACAEEVRTGAEDGSEMGAFALLKQPQREANIRTRLDEYLPFGLEAGLIFVT